MCRLHRCSLFLSVQEDGNGGSGKAVQCLFFYLLQCLSTLVTLLYTIDELANLAALSLCIRPSFSRREPKSRAARSRKNDISAEQPPDNSPEGARSASYVAGGRGPQRPREHLACCVEGVPGARTEGK